ncbi:MULTISPECIES: tripartite tricarboxylate transporter substrate binding protein [unclassified Beijerinckia]|uniref:Bug family tripartite tricarboxylate transporter substrate binding protein n=1 Tax=unclassified Beijerinckia TaxID=2638183 RepID=UPI00089CBAAC|nr:MULTISPECIES: tripartite tricarboxylate transporter substrate binding protein [unclassified Beijerinckia]MDH7798578.1 tripartite-type tricarboxylate transporter receptor subunit TctC [Beijerinckia sp. GAS462]SED25532.1 Tripartite-type tricarboxylate transporter, receptor component TctC [Beijerinckia sp. 28-YEA-48]
MRKLFHRPAAMFAAALFSSTFLTVAAPTAQAQDNSFKPIRWIVPYPAGGGTDVVARAIGQQMSTLTGHPVVIENKPGAATAIGAQDVARSAPDGATIISGDNGTYVFNPFLFSKLSYKVDELAPIGLLARFPLVLAVSPDTPYKTFADLAAAAKANPEAVKFASPGTGSPHHLAMEMLMSRSGLAAVHVPYRGMAPAVQDVLSGHVPVMVVDTVAGQTHFAAGKLRPLAVFSAKRLASLPDVPTFLELGQSGVELYAWQGIAAAGKTPKPMLDKLSVALNEALKNAATRKPLEDMGVEILGGTPEAMADYIKSETAIWGKLIQERGLKIE